jgi:hypothetical protein
MTDATTETPSEQAALTPYRRRLRDEALRVYHRYTVEIVEALGLCPWAERARLDGHVERYVLFGRAPDMDAVLAQVADVIADTRVAVGLLIFPELTLGRAAFQRFLSEMRERDTDRYPLGGVPLAMAAFHPDAQPDMSSAARLVSFIRRTPDPTIQLVRQSVLAEVRPNEDEGTQFAGPEILDPSMWPAAPPAPLHLRIAEANLNKIARVGVAEVTAILDDIRRDRDRAYAAIPRDDDEVARGGQSPGE